MPTKIFVVHFVWVMSGIMGLPKCPPITSSEMEPPSFELRDRFERILLTSNSSSHNVVDNHDNEARFIYSCNAPYPIAISYATMDFQDTKSGVPFVIAGGVRVHSVDTILFTDRRNFSTYTFFTKKIGMLRKINKDITDHKRTIACLAIHNPCLHQSIQILYGEEYWVPIKFWRASAMSGQSPPTVPMATDTGISLRSDDNNHNGQDGSSSCDLTLYWSTWSWYNDEDDDSSYVLRCEFGRESRPGILHRFDCHVKSTCDSFFGFVSPSSRARVCIRPDDHLCRNCSHRLLHIGTHREPWIPICSPLNSSVNRLTGGYDEESIFGNVIYFGMPLPLKPYKGLQMLFEEELTENSTQLRQRMLTMDYFAETQLLNSIMAVKCVTQKYYFSAFVQFALQLKGREDLVEISVKNITHVDRDSKVIYHRGWIPLDDARVERIFCLVHVQGTTEWWNVSRPIRIVDLKNIYQSQKCGNLTPLSNNNNTNANKTTSSPRSSPRFTLKWKQNSDLETLSQKLRGQNKKITLKNDDPGGLRGALNIEIICRAPYPVQLVYELNDDKSKTDTLLSSPAFDDLPVRSQYLLGKDEDFDVRQKFMLTSMVIRNQIFRCQSIQNPCHLHASLEYSLVGGGGGNNPHFQFVLLPSSQDEENAVAPKMVPQSSLLPPIGQECEVMFFYQKLRASTSFEFDCALKHEGLGTVQFHYCDTSDKCNNLLRHGRQPKTCWKYYDDPDFKEWNLNINSWSQTVRTLRPFKVTCTGGPPLQGGLIRDVVVPSFSNFAVFGLAKEVEDGQNIYFSEEDIDPNDMIYVSHFDEFQVLNTTLLATCSASAFYCERFLVLTTTKEEGVDLRTPSAIEQYDFGKGDLSMKYDQKYHAWVIEREIPLTDVTVEGIYCHAFARNELRTIVASRPIHVQAESSPSIVVQVKMLDEEVDDEENNSEKKFLISKLEQGQSQILLKDSKNVSISCTAFGYPAPSVLWTSTTSSQPEPIIEEVNRTRVTSTIFYALVHGGVAGAYICTASNSAGSIKKSIHINVVEDHFALILSVSIVVPVSIIVFGLIVYLVHRHIQTLEEQLSKRDLTDAEVNNFFEGDSNSPLERVNGRILTQPYDHQALEISEDKIVLDQLEVLGVGQFGIVFKGYVKRDNPKDQEQGICVAVKKPKEDVNVHTFMAILEEIKTMAFLENHENVAKLIGASTAAIKQRHVLVVVEYCENGDLQKFLQKHRPPIPLPITMTIELDLAEEGSNIESCHLDTANGTTQYVTMEQAAVGQPEPLLMEELSVTDLLKFAAQIANGMSHLTRKKVIHGDLAARNILLTSEKVIKISDFGLSRRLLNYATYVRDKKPQLLPWRWMSIEALKQNKFSIESDVWSFGITLYEIFTLGENPYPSVPECDEGFVSRLVAGYRMARPSMADEKIYSIMMDCWEKEPSQRPSFDNVRQLLIEMIE